MPLPLMAAGLWCASPLLAPALYAQAGVAPAPASELLDARAAHERGVVAFAQGDFERAIEAFGAADRLQPLPALAFNIARCYEQLHDQAHALRFYRLYLERAPNAGDRLEIEQRADGLAAQLATRDTERVRLQAQPDGASVWLDGEPVGRAPVELTLPSGLHRVRFTLPGHRAHATTFMIRAGEQAPHAPVRAIDAQLEPVQAAPAAPVAGGDARLPAADGGRQDAAAAATSGRPLLRDLGFSAMLASVAALGGAVAFELMRSDAERSLRGEPNPQHIARAVDRLQTTQTLSRVFAGAGGGLAALGVTLLVLSRADDARETARTRVALHCAPAKCRAELSGMF